jgi:hypothetical protein
LLDRPRPGIIALANAIPDMEAGALTKFDVSNNRLGTEGAKALAVGLKGNQVITELNIATNYFGINQSTGERDTLGVIAIADAIRDMRAISSVNLLKNEIGVEQAQALVIILKEHLTLKTLCGNNGNETELTMSGKMRGPGDAIMLVPDVIDSGALTSLNVSDNNLTGYGEDMSGKPCEHVFGLLI